MTKVVKSPDCGNSPKNQLVQALAIAIEKSDRAVFSRCVADHVSWTLPDRRSLEGKAASVAYLPVYRPASPAKVTVRRAVSHGRAGAADGVVVMQAGRTLGFCHVVEFTSAKGEVIASITTYHSEGA